jgi:hypothetical protein
MARPFLFSGHGEPGSGNAGNENKAAPRARGPESNGPGKAAGPRNAADDSPLGTGSEHACGRGDVGKAPVKTGMV